MIPYEKIKSWSDLDSRPEGVFFAKTEFLSAISDAEYENVKKFWKTLSLNKLSELNDICNFQDTKILCEIFQNKASECPKDFPTTLENVPLPVPLAAVSIDICPRL